MYLREKEGWLGVSYKAGNDVEKKRKSVEKNSVVHLGAEKRRKKNRD